jgi:hypothetical protein
MPSSADWATSGGLMGTNEWWVQLQVDRGSTQLQGRQCMLPDEKSNSSAYTLTDVISRDPVGWPANMKEDSAMAARRIITVVEIVAEALLTLVKMLCIVEATME